MGRDLVRFGELRRRSRLPVDFLFDFGREDLEGNSFVESLVLPVRSIRSPH